MASLQKIKGRIALVDNISKITHAMELVSTSKLKKVQNHYLKVQAYANRVQAFLSQLSNYLDLNKYLPCEGNKTLYLLISSDFGLAGAYNSDLYKSINQILKPQEDFLIIVGRKMHNYFANRDVKILGHFFDLKDIIDFSVAEKISKLILEIYYQKKIDRIKILYTKFINVITSEKAFFELMPFSAPELQKEQKKANANLEFLPNPETVFEKTLPLYLSSYIYAALAQSKVAEIASRRVAMESATKNAQDLKEQLVLDYNRVRQSKITQEIAEIVAGVQN